MNTTNRRAQSHRQGYPGMTAMMFLALGDLSVAKAAGIPFLALEGVHWHTLNALINRDWIFSPFRESGDAEVYAITRRRERALKFYTPTVKRSDGICPTCGECPVHTSKNGRKFGYCLECHNRHTRRQVALKGHQFKPDSLCPGCGERPRHTYPSGYQIAYCKVCLKGRRREEKQRKMKRLLERIRRGDPPICLRQGCSEPRHHTPKVVYDYCRRHYFEYQKGYRLRQKLKAIQEAQP